jgi:hypothetical protein
MSNPVDAVCSVSAYSIPVGTAVKKEAESFTYTATSTIKTLHAWIYERMGIPPEQQKIFVYYLHQGRKEIPNSPDQPLTQYLADASRIEVFLKQRGS